MPTRSTKLLLKILFSLILGLVLLGPISFAQTDDEASGNGPAAIQEDHDTKNLDKLLKDYNQDSEKVLKDAEKMLPEESGGQPEMDAEEELALEATKAAQKFDPTRFKKKAKPSDLKNVKYSEAIKVALAPLQQMSEAELVALLKENTKDSGAEEYVNRFPKLLLFAVRLIKDKEALPMLVRTADDQQKSIRFAGIMLCTILFSILLKRFMKREGRPIWKAISYWFLRFFIVSAMRFALILFFYSAEVMPTLKIAGQTFF